MADARDDVPLGGDDEPDTSPIRPGTGSSPQGPPLAPRGASGPTPPRRPATPRFEDVVRGLNLPGVDAVAGGAMLDTLLGALRPADPVEGLPHEAQDRARALLVAGKAKPGGTHAELLALARFILEVPRG